MYLQNKYTKWYNSIILNAQNRCIQGYVEKHHIIPKSLGGTNDEHNIVKLTAREHFLCHRLLTKMTTGLYRYKMLNAAFMMVTNNNPFQERYRINSRTYDRLRTEWASRIIPEEIRKKIGLKSKGRIQSSESRRKNSEANSGKNNPMYGKTHTEEARKKISDAAKLKKGKPGKPHSPETKEKIRESIKRRYQEASSPDF